MSDLGWIEHIHLIFWFVCIFFRGGGLVSYSWVEIYVINHCKIYIFSRLL